MSKQMIELIVDTSTDVFKVKQLLEEYPGVKPHVTTMDSMRIYYQTDKTEEKEILSIIAACGKNKRVNNILSIKRKNLSNEQSIINEQPVGKREARDFETNSEG